MPIKVRFDKNGFYHPAYGRLGRGKHEGEIYILPDEFAETETTKFPVMDRTSKPPRKVDEIERTRYKLLPSTVEIIDDERMEEIIEEAEDEGRDPPKAVRPKVATPEHLEKITGAGKKRKAQPARERTTGAPKTRSRKVEAAE